MNDEQKSDVALATLRAVAPQASDVWVDADSRRFVARVREPDGTVREGSAPDKFMAIQAALTFYGGHPHSHAAFDNEGDEMEPRPCERRNCDLA